MANTVKRAATFAPGIGKNLTELLGKDVTVTHTWVGERMFDGDMRPIVILTLDNGDVYHAWSASLCDKIAEIPVEEFPLVFKFVRVDTRKAGQSVITFE